MRIMDLAYLLNMKCLYLVRLYEPVLWRADCVTSPLNTFAEDCRLDIHMASEPRGPSKTVFGFRGQSRDICHICYVFPEIKHLIEDLRVLRFGTKCIVLWSRNYELA